MTKYTNPPIPSMTWLVFLFETCLNLPEKKVSYYIYLAYKENNVTNNVFIVVSAVLLCFCFVIVAQGTKCIMNFAIIIAVQVVIIISTTITSIPIIISPSPPKASTKKRSSISHRTVELSQSISNGKCQLTWKRGDGTFVWSWSMVIISVLRHTTLDDV